MLDNPRLNNVEYVREPRVLLALHGDLFKDFVCFSLSCRVLDQDVLMMIIAVKRIK